MHAELAWAGEAALFVNRVTVYPHVFQCNEALEKNPQSTGEAGNVTRLSKLYIAVQAQVVG